MASKTLSVEASLIYQVSYDPDSTDFQEALKEYFEMNPGEKHKVDTKFTKKDHETMIKHIVFHVQRFGTDTMVEGAGYVSVKGKRPDGFYSGVDFMEEDPDAEIEIV